MGISTFNQLNLRTADGRFTQRNLIAKIKEIAKLKGYNNEVAESAIKSFVMNGIIETYDELGYQKWIEMIRQIVDHEAIERGIRRNVL